MRRALDEAPEAKDHFGWLAPSHRAAFEEWVRASFDTEERRRRIEAAVSMLMGKV